MSGRLVVGWPQPERSFAAALCQIWISTIVKTYYCDMVPVENETNTREDFSLFYSNNKMALPVKHIIVLLDML